MSAQTPKTPKEEFGEYIWELIKTMEEAQKSQERINRTPKKTPTGRVIALTEGFDADTRSINDRFIKHLRDLMTSRYKLYSVTDLNEMISGYIDEYNRSLEEVLNTIKQVVAKQIGSVNTLESSRIKVEQYESDNKIIINHMKIMNERYLTPARERIKELAIRDHVLQSQEKFEKDVQNLIEKPALLLEREISAQKHLRGINSDFEKSYKTFLDIYKTLESKSKDKRYIGSKNEIDEMLRKLQTIRSEVAVTIFDLDKEDPKFKDVLATKFEKKMEEATNFIKDKQKTIPLMPDISKKLEKMNKEIGTAKEKVQVELEKQQKKQQISALGAIGREFDLAAMSSPSPSKAQAAAAKQSSWAFGRFRRAKAEPKSDALSPEPTRKPKEERTVKDTFTSDIPKFVLVDIYQ